MSTKTHYKKLMNPDYLGAYDFDPEEKERLVTIKTVKREMVTGPGGKKEECTVIYFTEPYKPMIANATNLKRIHKIMATPYIEEWAGRQMKLVTEKVNAFGEVVDAIRVKPETVAAKVRPTLEIGTDNFTNCRSAVQSGQYTVDDIRKKYTVSDEVAEALTRKDDETTEKQDDETV